jgi:hypothetical protein
MPKPPSKARPSRKSAVTATLPPAPSLPEPAAQEPIGSVDKSLIKLISNSINDLADENGWAFLGELGNLLMKKKPNFDPRNYGFKKLVPLIKSINRFEVDERDTGKGNTTLVYVKTK